MDIISNMLSRLCDGHALVGSTDTVFGTAVLAVAPAGDGRFWVTAGLPSMDRGTVWREATTAVAPAAVPAALTQCSPGADWSAARWSIEPYAPRDGAGVRGHADPGALADFWKAVAKLLNGDHTARAAGAA
ncbi:hypothetical protein GJ689_11465 [Rhodoplanes serenus]|uniref:Uncharacterized protein n=1 Tax=Rhodoplanes serenus TaxID=200615 RepID=A0A9X4XKE9_9BRAD|nr:hypothetical protein [Rhodoplanes serenus]MTW16823.1 hypothetical protein [Rhodoplanes serenus]